MNRCRKLAEYSIFIAKIHAYWKECGDLEEAVKKAIIYCQRHGILVEYLEIHGSEILNMILTEWNTEDAIAFARNEGREDGLEEGLEKGREEGLEIGREEVFKLLEQGLSVEEIKLRLASVAR